MENEPVTELIEVPLFEPPPNEPDSDPEYTVEVTSTVEKEA